MNKTCRNCKVDKDTIEFYKMTSGPDGLQNWCKPCMISHNNAKAKERKANGPTIIRDAKVCQDCNTRKPINQFYVKRGHSADGYGSYCKPCWVKRTVMNQKNAAAKRLK